MLRVTADSNIYISAMNFGGAPDKLLDMARNGDIVLAISDPIVEEVTHVLRDKFGWTDEAIKLAQARIADFTEKVHPRRAIDVVKEDPSDNRILDCAEAGGSEFIVTGDAHLS
ncbi:MAG: putative toxin-antitoxin system toxin component, PIN family [Candidatus Sulfotelmatobacter sp.]